VRWERLTRERFAGGGELIFYSRKSTYPNLSLEGVQISG